MSLNVVFLGTSGSIPTPQRGLPSIAIQREGELILFDCGEGSQRQMIKAEVGFNRKTKVFITHMHGDHVLGLPGLFQTMSLLGRTRKLEIYGPQGIGDFVEAIKRTIQFTLTFPMKIIDVKEAGVVCEEKEYVVRVIWASHLIPSLAYALIEKPRPGKFNPKKATALGVPQGPMWSDLQSGLTVKLPTGRSVTSNEVVGLPRPGRKIVYTGDTKPSSNFIKFVENADLLIHDSTFDDELSERATRDGHSTASQAAKVAKESNVKRLVLTHISARYKNPIHLVEQARTVFPRVDLAEDFMKIELPFLEEKLP